MWEWPQVSDNGMKGTEYINNFIYIYIYTGTCYFLFAYGQLGADLKKKSSKKYHFMVILSYGLQQSISMSRLKLLSNN